MRRSSYDCLTEREVEQFVLHQMDEPVLSSVEEHLLVCAKCLERVEHEEGFVSELKAAAVRLEAEAVGAGAPAGKAGSGFFRPTKAWVAAGLMAAAMLAGFAVIPRSHFGQDEAKVALVLQRSGSMIETAMAPAETPLRLMVDVTELPPAVQFHLELVDGNGRRLAEGEAPVANGKLAWSTGRTLAPGAYWVRLSQAAGKDLLREFALRVQ